MLVVELTDGARLTKRQAIAWRLITPRQLRMFWQARIPEVTTVSQLRCAYTRIKSSEMHAPFCQ
jgi:hypothetical protein